MAIVGGVGATDNIVQLKKGVEFADFIQPDHMGFNASLLCNSSDVHMPIEFFLVACKANSAARMPARGLSRLLFQRLVHLYAIVVDA